jgi:hypothetical protein
MPTYPVGVDPNHYRAHLPATATNSSSVACNPAELQVPVDVRTFGEPTIVEGIGSFQKGSLLKPVTATFYDGFQKTYPVDSSVIIFHSFRVNPNFIMLDSTEDGEPIPAIVGGRRRRRSTRRGRRVTHRKRRSTRRNA